MDNEGIYYKVKKEINSMVLECYEGIKIELRPKIMNFVTKAITRTLNYKDQNDSFNKIIYMIKWIKIERRKLTTRIG